MSLRGLVDSLGPPSVESLPVQPHPKTVTLAFALDSGYLEAFKVMIASLVASGSFVDAPVVIYTDDPTVCDDPIVKRCADRVSLLSGARKETLYYLAKTSVERRNRSDWNRGTFLKWAVFEKQETDAVLFLDVDMLCLENIHDLLEQHPDRMMVCANQFKPSLRRDEAGKKLFPRQQRERLLGSLTGEVTEDMAARINSGVMLIRKPALSNAFFEKITAFASEQKTVNEQGQFSRYFAQRPEKIGIVGTAYNFLENEMNDLAWNGQFELMKRIKVLHYAGSPKPWSRDLSRETRPGVLQWHRYRTFADRILRLDISKI